MDLEGFLGEQFLDVLRPFHQAQAAAVQIVVQADVEGLLQPLDPVEIKVVHRLARAGAVLVHDGERRGAHGILAHAEPLAHGRREGRLPGRHRRVERNQFPVPDGLEEFPRGPVQVLQVLDMDFVHHDPAKLIINPEYSAGPGSGSRRLRGGGPAGCRGGRRGRRWCGRS